MALQLSLSPLSTVQRLPSLLSRLPSLLSVLVALQPSLSPPSTVLQRLPSLLVAWSASHLGERSRA